MQNNEFRRQFAIAFGAAVTSFSLLFATIPAAAQATPENLVVWREGFLSSAQPTKEYLKQVKKQGYDLVINLAPPQSMGSIETEGALVAAQGVPYINIPVDFRNPTQEDFKLFSEAMKSASGKKVLVHCQVNMRGSSFSFLYRVIYEGAPVGDTLSKLTGVWTPDPVWKRFIEDTLAAHGKKAEVL